MRELRREKQRTRDLVDYDIFAHDGDELFDDSNDLFPADEDLQDTEVVIHEAGQDKHVSEQDQ